MHSLYQEGKFDCSFSNPKFAKFLIGLSSMLKSYLVSLEHGRSPNHIGLGVSKEFSYFMVPFEESINLDSFGYSKVFIGEHSKEFTEVYYRFLEIWKNAQMINFPEKDLAYTWSKTELRKDLRSLRERVISLLKKQTANVPPQVK